jgi:hypothetical protein
MLRFIPQRVRMWLYRMGLLKPKAYWEPCDGYYRLRVEPTPTDESVWSPWLIAADTPQLPPAQPDPQAGE